MENWNCSILCEDILVEILCKVPDKALVRLKLVSKAWNLLISEICLSPIYFRARARPVAGLFFRSYVATFQHIIYRDRISLYFFRDVLQQQWRDKSFVGRYASVDDDVKKKSVVLGWEECIGSRGLPFCPHPDEFLGCCNGLLLFVNIEEKQYYVSNPSTGQCLSIPPLPLPHKKNYLFAALAFDPSRSSHFKVVRFETNLEETCVVLDVYSSAQGSWSRHSVGECGMDLHIRFTTYFEGALFRLSYLYRVIRYGGFEEDEEVSVRELKLPFDEDAREWRGVRGSLGVLMGQLCYGLGYGSTVRIWSLHDHDHDHDHAGTWTLRHTIHISDDLCRLHRLNRVWGDDDTIWVEPNAFHPTANLVYLSSPLAFLVYDLENHKLRVLFRSEDQHQFLPTCYYPAFPYVRHLAPFPTPTPGSLVMDGKGKMDV